MEYDFDEQNLRETAEVVIAINPFVEVQPVERLMAEMKKLAMDSLDEDNTYVSTRGYMLTGYVVEYGTIGVKASISSFVVKEFLKKKGKV
jgi:hypothetical protein